MRKMIFIEKLFLEMDDILSEISSTDGNLTITDAIKNHLAAKRETLLNLGNEVRVKIQNFSAEMRHLEETGDDSVRSYKIMKRKIKEVNKMSEMLENFLQSLDGENSNAQPLRPVSVTQVIKKTLRKFY